MRKLLIASGLGCVVRNAPSNDEKKHAIHNSFAVE